MFTTPPEPEIQEQELEVATQPPHDAAMERALVGAAMQSIVVFRSVSEIVADRDFYIHRNQFIWQAIAQYAAEDIQVDPLIIFDECSKSPWLSVDFAYISRCQDESRNCLTIETAQEYARRIKEFSTRRTMLTMANRLAQNAYDLQKAPGASISESLAFMQGEALKQPGSLAVNARDASSQLYDYVEKASKNPDAIGYLTGLTDFDKTTGGFSRGTSWIVAGRPGQGKTGFILTAIANMNYDFRTGTSRVYKPHVILNNMEMTVNALMQRLAGMVGKIDTEKIRRGALSDDERVKFNEAIAEIGSWPMIIIDERDPIILMSRVAQYVAIGQCDILFNDYIGKFEAKAESRVRQVGIASQYMSKIAVQFDIPVVTNAQVSRTIDTRGKDSHLVLSDLKETGDIEQDADGVLFLNPDAQNPNVRFCEIAKHRHGRKGTFNLLFQGQFTTFVNAVSQTMPQKP